MDELKWNELMKEPIDELYKEVLLAKASLEEAKFWYKLCLLDGKGQFWQEQRIEELHNAYVYHAGRLMANQLANNG